MAAYSATKHFRHFLEGRIFTLYTDHKPLTTALTSQADRFPRQTRHLSYIAEFTCDIGHIKDKFNVVADALSRVTTVDYVSIDGTGETATDLPTVFSDILVSKQRTDLISHDHLARDQKKSDEMNSYRTVTTGPKLEDIDIGQSTLLCDASLGTPRPILPTTWTRSVFDRIHGFSHAGVRPTQKAISQRFVWHGMKRDIRRWCKECPDCQASNIHRHTRAPLTGLVEHSFILEGRSWLFTC